MSESIRPKTERELELERQLVRAVSMLRDLDAGYAWRELVADMPLVVVECEALGLDTGDWGGRTRPTYTVFCRERGGLGTTWVGYVEAADHEAAVEVGRAQCAADWVFDLDSIHVLGVAEGDVKILHWEDEWM